MDNTNYIVAEPRKKFRHSWDKITGSGLLKHHICKRCGCQKYNDLAVQSIVYIDKEGKRYYRAPNCKHFNFNVYGKPSGNT